ncbi:MAG: sulfite exporter TauE/SafE family protein [Desulfobacterales bacterium]|nr:sulfite exporter TauE/SafE family protein [Desulfobacterales bacterium]
MLDPQYLWLVCPLVALGAFTQGFTGLGFGIVILAGIVFIPWDFERSTVVVNLLVLVLHGSVIRTSIKDMPIQWNLIGMILLGMAFGVPLGYAFILFFGNDPVFRIVFGLSLAGFAAYELIKPRIKPVPKYFGFPAGLIGGFFGGAFTTSGPPIAIYLYSQNKQPALLKGTLQIVFMITTIWRLINIVLFGPGIGRSVIEIFLICLLIVAFFAFIGHKMSLKVSSKWFLRIVYTVIAIAGLVNIAQAIFSGMNSHGAV